MEHRQYEECVRSGCHSGLLYKVSGWRIDLIYIDNQSGGGWSHNKEGSTAFLNQTLIAQYFLGLDDLNLRNHKLVM